MSRRRVGLLLTCATLVLALVAIAGRGGGVGGPASAAGAGDSSAGRVDAIFDTAKGIVPGQVVKVAGARVGNVSDVRLTDDFKARIQLDIDPRFTPFRMDARCDIQPEGLISENFVQCDPGTVDAPELKGTGGEAPTVAIERTSAPVNLTDLFEIWEAPVRDRLRLVLNTLGGGVAGRGEELNDVLRRANPTLGLVHDAVGILDEQKVGLQRSIVQAKVITKELARQPKRLQAFVDEGANVFETTANRREKLREGVRELPSTLSAARATLPALNAFAQQGAPLSRRISASAQPLDALLAQIPPTAKVALPALRALDRTGDRARPAVRSARPVARRLANFARKARPTLALTDRVLTDGRRRGLAENLLSFAYYAAAATSRYDAISHIFPANVVASGCATFATKTQPECDANYTRSASSATAAKRARARSRREAQDTEPPSSAPSPAAAASALAAPGTPAADKPGLAPVLPGVTAGPKPAPSARVRDLLDYLLGP